MCVDDYQFRHFSARREKICKKFIIINEDQVSRSFYVNISQFQQYGHIALCKILLYLTTKGLLIQNKKFYLPKFNAIILPFTRCTIEFQALCDPQIIVKTYSIGKQAMDIFVQNQNNSTQEEIPNSDNCFCRFEDENFIEEQAGFAQNTHSFSQSRQNTMMEEEIPLSNSDQMQEKSSSDEVKRLEQNHKKMKQSERGISQVIKAVKIWRGLHQSKLCNLTNAAKIVGISKKSLDDYYLVLRSGEILGFDFKNNLDHKMGDLRNFIRSKQQKVSGKLGKNNIECFKLVQDYNLDDLIREYQNNASTAF